MMISRDTANSDQFSAPKNSAAPRILVADDHSDNLYLLETVLKSQRYQVETATNGVDALAVVEANPPELVLLDVMMPGLDGYEVARRIKSNPALPFVPIILVTAKSDLTDKIFGLEVGADDFLSKPVNAGELLARVRALLRLKTAQDDLQQVNLQLKQSEVLREELVHMITHDLRGPLTGLIGALELMEDLTLGPLTEGQERFVNLALNNCNTLSNMIGDLLEVYRLEAGHSALQREPLDIAMLAEYTCAQIQGVALEKKLSLNNTVPPGLPRISGDRSKLLRVFSNLMSNALKFTDNGGITISAEVWDGKVGPEARGVCPPDVPSLLVKVIDSGLGIPEEVRSRVFEKFYRVQGRQGNKEVVGTGLGLNFCKQVIDAHGGCIWVESGPGGSGSAFNMTLPLAQE